MTPHDEARDAGPLSDFDCQDLLGKVGNQTCDTVLLEVCRAEKLGLTITIWDLPQVTGLQLHEAFAAVRLLEFGQLLIIGDNPSDPFGATLRLDSRAAERLRNRHAA